MQSETQLLVFSSMLDGVEVLQQTFNSDECKGVVAPSDVWLGSTDALPELHWAGSKILLVSYSAS